MRLSTRSRYGTRLMFQLALHYKKEPLLLREISKEEDISEKYLSQIIIPLKTAGLINSTRGARGGYTLARPPAQISIRQIVELLEGDLSSVDCVKDPGSCDRFSHCTAQKVWSRLSKEIVRVLEEITLEDLVKDYESGSSKGYVYHI